MLACPAVIDLLAAVRHFLRIRPCEGGIRTVRNGIVLMTRIMSMDDEEIFAWLNEMFDGTAWGPEYPALLFGFGDGSHCS